MRKFINMFLSTVIPFSALFIVAATIYFSMSYDLNKALKLGVLSGFMVAVVVAFLTTVILLLMRRVQHDHTAKNHPEEMIEHGASNGPIDKSFILLMDRVMAFEVALHSIIDQQIGEVSKNSNRKKGNITVFSPEQTIRLHISPLTKHTAKVSIESDRYNENVKNIINYVKAKEHSFLKY